MTVSQSILVLAWCFLQKAILFLTMIFLREERLLSGIAGQHAKPFLANSLDGPRRHVRPASTSLISSLAVVKGEGGPPMQTLTAWESQFYCLASGGIYWLSLLAKPDNHLYFLYHLKLFAVGILKILTVMSKNRQVPFILSAPSRLSCQYNQLISAVQCSHM